jgi:adenine-specific DNA-methyltransferase
VQFLGTKTRVLPALVAAVEAEISGRGAVCDIFTGTSVVAQGVARAGHTVSAFDALEHCAAFARALLGVGRAPDEVLPRAEELPRADDSWTSLWEWWLAAEDAAVKGGDADALIRLGDSIPQMWRPRRATPALSRLFRELRPGILAARGLVAAHYAGTYFGVRQAVEIDLLRQRITAARAAGALSSWQESAMMTALLSSASECVFSAGKHYAQPHRIRDGKDLRFVRRRILDDRRKSVSRLFPARLQTINDAALADEGHRAARATLEELARAPDRVGEVEAIYADPPYAAQQYSRFYHVPEVLTSYRVPALQRVSGEITRGLYPVGRHKSRFCSRRDAPSAFDDLCRLATTKGATLLVSYSYSRNGETGNKRSIDLTQLRSLLTHHFREVIEHEIDVTYRQFNATSASVEARSDAEILLVGRRHA